MRRSESYRYGLLASTCSGDGNDIRTGKWTVISIFSQWVLKSIDLHLCYLCSCREQHIQAMRYRIRFSQIQPKNTDPWNRQNVHPYQISRLDIDTTTRILQEISRLNRRQNQRKVLQQDCTESRLVYMHVGSSQSLWWSYRVWHW